jgi:cobalt-zinc-cadmium efflux system protein
VGEQVPHRHVAVTGFGTEASWRAGSGVAAIKGRLRDDFGITHSTLEFEDAEAAHRDAARFGPGAGRRD